MHERGLGFELQSGYGFLVVNRNMWLVIQWSHAIKKQHLKKL